MSDEEILRGIKSQTIQLIQSLTAAPKPSYAIDGQSVSWSDYLAQLRETVAWCDRQLGSEDPFEFPTQGYT